MTDQTTRPYRSHGPDGPDLRWHPEYRRGWGAAQHEIDQLRAQLAEADDVIWALELGLNAGEKWTVERMDARDAAIARNREALK